MLQALLALGLVISFLPMFANKMHGMNESRENAAAAAQMMAAWDAARAFVREEFDNLSDGIKIYSDAELAMRLEPFGLPLGFSTSTPLGGKISLMIGKNGPNMLALILATRGKASELRSAEIMARLGFWGAIPGTDGILRGATGGWETDEIPGDMPLPDAILMRVPEDEEFSELVVRNAKRPSKNAFHTPLGMDGNNISAVSALRAMGGKIKNAAAADFVLSGTEADRKNRNEIGSVRTDKALFRSPDGNPLTITRSDLQTGDFSATSIAEHGDTGGMTAGTVSVRDFNMTAGSNSFSGPATWDIKTNAYLTNITLNVEKLSISTFLDTSRGQDVFISQTDSSQLEYASGSGITAGTIKAEHITLRDQISSELLSGGNGMPLLEIRPAGTSLLPDALISGINNDELAIPLDAGDNAGKTEPCRAIVARAGGRYDSASLAGAIVCRFVMLNRIERRLDIKKCLDAGGSNCE
ncbi:MAG: hypothetical protein LBB08_01630 [Rickettsiales bacterium]|nr:hypothetical protein [Rickettsiales bacterium]